MDITSANNTADVIMRAVHNAQKRLVEGDAASARKMAINADALCSKCVAPPPVHGLVLRVLADACMGCNEPQGAREALQRGAKMNATAADRGGLHPTLKIDCLARLGDLRGALAEVERSCNNDSASVRASRQSAEAFERMGPQGQHFAAAAHNRCAQLLVLSGEPDVALESLAVALALAEKSTAHGAQLKAQGGLVRGHALRCKGELGAAYAAYSNAQHLAAETNSERIMEEITKAIEDVTADPAFEMPGAVHIPQSAFL
jgi:tetratricopeptide (TPR) repeat protein